MATKVAKKQGTKSGAKSGTKAAKKKSSKTKESPERATFREEVEQSSRYHLEKWALEIGETLKTVKQAEDGELVDSLLTAFDGGNIALNDLAPKGKITNKKPAKKATNPDDDDIDDLVDDELGDYLEDEGENVDDDIDDDLGDDDDDLDLDLDDDEETNEETNEEEDPEETNEEEDPEDEGKSAIEDKLDNIISQNTKIADRLDKMSKQQTTVVGAVIGVNDNVKLIWAFLRIFGKTMLKISKVKDTVFDKIVKKARVLATKDDSDKEAE